MVNPIFICPVNKENWQEAISITLHETQEKLVPSVIESLAYAFIKPWDEAFDPYLLCHGDETVGFFYLSYTPDSRDNYWFGGFQLDKHFQGKGLGEQSLVQIIEFIKDKHIYCEIISLTIEKSNEKARKLYEKLGFKSVDRLNDDGEIIYKLKLEEI